MTQEELKIIEELKSNKELSLIPAKEYSDEFYAECINSFQKNKKRRLFYRFIKRAFDICVSFIAITVLLIPFAICSIWIKYESKGPVIFKNRRVGKNGDIFHCWKFRSMRTDAPKEQATSILVDADKYITKSGRFMRKTSIDELPQLFNVLSGKMSLIGYRPLVPTEKKCNDMRAALSVFDMAPGISGYAQIHGRDDCYYKNKALFDAYYVKNAGFGMDFKILFGSVAVVLSRKGNQDNLETKQEKGK